MICLGVGLFASILFGTLCASWTCMSISFTKLGKFTFIIFSNRFPISCSFSSPSDTPMMQMLDLLKWSQRLLTLSSFVWIHFSSCCSDWSFYAFLCSKSLIWFSASPILLLFHCKLFFISVSVSFVSDSAFFMLSRSSLSYLSILITRVLNFGSDRLLISILFSYFSGVLICSFTWAMFLCLLM